MNAELIDLLKRRAFDATGRVIDRLMADALECILAQEKIIDHVKRGTP